MGGFFFKKKFEAFFSLISPLFSSLLPLFSTSKPANQPVTVKLREADGTEILFKVKRSTPMNRVFSAFYNKKNAQPGSYRFMFDGERLEDNDTAETKDMDDNCVVDVQLEQTGGR